MSVDFAPFADAIDIAGRRPLRGSAPCDRNTDGSGMSSLAPSRDAHHRAVGHEGGVERERRASLVAWCGKARSALSSPPSSALGQRLERRAACSVLERGQLRARSAPLTNTIRYASSTRQRRPSAAIEPRQSPPSAGRHRRERQRLLQRVTQVGVFPLLDAPVRQAERRRTRRSPPRARPRPQRRPGSLRRGSVELLGERLLGLGLHLTCHMSSASWVPASSHSSPCPPLAGERSLSSRLARTRRSPTSPARAPAPCRPTSGSGRRPAHAPCRARCSRAAADSA